MLPPAEMLSQVDIQNNFNIFRQELRDKYLIASTRQTGGSHWGYKPLLPARA